MEPELSAEQVEAAASAAGPCSFDAQSEFPSDILRIRAVLAQIGVTASDDASASLWEESSASYGAGWVAVSSRFNGMFPEMDSAEILTRLKCAITAHH